MNKCNELLLYLNTWRKGLLLLLSGIWALLRLLVGLRGRCRRMAVSGSIVTLVVMICDGSHGSGGGSGGSSGGGAAVPSSALPAPTASTISKIAIPSSQPFSYRPAGQTCQCTVSQNYGKHDVIKFSKCYITFNTLRRCSNKKSE